VGGCRVKNKQTENIEMTDGHKDFPREPHVGQLWCMGLIDPQSWCGDFGQELDFLPVLAVGP
jgi:hypothetical protein